MAEDESLVGSQQTSADAYQADRTLTHDSNEEPELVEGTQYLQLSKAHGVPTKTGEEDAVSDDMPSGARPSTPWRMNGSLTDFDNTEDSRRFAALTAVHRKDSETDGRFANPADGLGSFITRPITMENPIADAEFSFAKATIQQMDFTGTRKSPAASESGLRLQSAQINAKESGVADQASQPPVNDGFQQEPCDAQIYQPERKRRMKNRKRHHHDTGSPELEDQSLRAETRQGVLKHRLFQNVTDMTAVPEVNESLQRKVDPQQDARTPYGESSQRNTWQTQLQHDESASAPVEAAEALATDDHLKVIQIEHKSLPHEGYNQIQVQAFDEVGIDDCPKNKSPRISKRKSKRTRHTEPPAPMQAVDDEQSSSDVNDYLQILAYKVQQKKQTAVTNLRAERTVLHSELQQALQTNQALLKEFETFQQEKSSLTEMVQQQKTKLERYESKVNRFKTFIDGLGNDFDALKREASGTRRRAEQLSQEGNDRKVEQTALLDQLSSCTEKSAELKNEAVRACRNALADLQSATLRSQYLEKELNEKVGLLTEERDRRCQLERQVAVAASSEQSIQRMIETNVNAVLDKLFEIHATVEEAGSSNKIVEVIENVSASIQAIIFQQSSNADDIACMKTLIETLSDSVTSLPQDALTPNDHALGPSLKVHLDEAFKGLKADLDQREKQSRQDATHREMITALQEKLGACNNRISEATSQLSEGQTREEEFKRQIAFLQITIVDLQGKAAAQENMHLQLSKIKAELNIKSTALETANVDMGSKVDELHSLGMANADLNKEVQTLRSRLDGVSNQILEFGPEREELVRTHCEELQRVKHELTQAADDFHIQQKSKMDNEVQRLTAQKDDSRREMLELREELAAHKAELEKVQKQTRACDPAQSHDLEELKKVAESRKDEIEALQASLQSLQKARDCNLAAKEELGGLSTELAEAKCKMAEIVREKQEALNRTQDLQRAFEEAQSVAELTQYGLQDQQSQSIADIEILKQQLFEAKENAKRSEVGLQHYQQSCKVAIQEASEKHEKQTAAMQGRLTEAQNELQIRAANDENFRATVQASWEQERHRHQIQLAEAQRAENEAKVARGEAFTENEHLRKELEKLAEMVSAAEQKPMSRGTNQSTSRSDFHQLAEDVTPTASNKEYEPPKPRKKVDRNGNTLIETGPIPVPGVLKRPDSQTKERTPGVRRPVVENSQSQDIVPQPNLESCKARTRPTPFSASSDGGDMLDVASHAGRDPPQTIGETQYDDHLPSFAAFNYSMTSTTFPEHKSDSSHVSLPSLAGARQSMQDDVRQPSLYNCCRDGTRGMDPRSQNSTVFEDAQKEIHSPSPDRVDAQQHLQDSISLSQAEKEKYTFKKSFPISNSGKRRKSEAGSSSASIDCSVHTPNIRGDGQAPSSRGMHPKCAELLNITHSSSPDFVHNVSGRGMSTYHALAGSYVSKRRLSRTSSMPSADPRLAERQSDARSLPKRKSECAIVEVYAPERKKRLTVMASSQTLRADSQPSINDLPRLRSQPMGATNSSQSRVRTLASGPSRNTRGVKKMSQKDEFNARFSQELGRH